MSSVGDVLSNNGWKLILLIVRVLKGDCVRTCIQQKQILCGGFVVLLIVLFFVFAVAGFFFFSSILSARSPVHCAFGVFNGLLRFAGAAGDKPDVQGDDVDNFEFGGGEMDMGGMDFGGNGDELNLEDDLPELNQVRFFFFE